MSNAAEVEERVESELQKISDTSILEQIKTFLIPPFPVDLGWNYGDPHQTYGCWTVLEHPDSNTKIVYCVQGFGPGSPWGVLFLSASNMGMDSDWFTYLEDAFRTSKVFKGENPPGYEVR